MLLWAILTGILKILRTGGSAETTYMVRRLPRAGCRSVPNRGRFRQSLREATMGNTDHKGPHRNRCLVLPTSQMPRQRFRYEEFCEVACVAHVA
jgi:hypothetical protein